MFSGGGVDGGRFVGTASHRPHRNPTERRAMIEYGCQACDRPTGGQALCLECADEVRSLTERAARRRARRDRWARRWADWFPSGKQNRPQP